MYLKEAGIHQNPLTFGLGIAIADINKDGWQDIYVTNDYNEPDYLYINNQDGTFKDDTKNCFRTSCRNFQWVLILRITTTMVCRMYERLICCRR